MADRPDTPYPAPDTLAQRLAAGQPFRLCDVSPPRGAAFEDLAAITAVPADGFCVAYAPGRAVRLDSLAAARVLQDASGRPSVFNLATRDMNALALANHLLAAEALGVPNAVVVRGDDFKAGDRERLRPVHDLTPTDLIALAAAMNRGEDLRGAALRAPTRLSVGATLDLDRGHEPEARLTARKVRAGASFLISQPIAGPDEAERFHAAYLAVNGEPLAVPVLWGFPILAKESITFGPVPDAWRRDLDAGRPGAELAAEQLARFRAAGLDQLYVMPPILRGGIRDYAAAAAALAPSGVRAAARGEGER